jgi:hypothetical protein
MIKRVFKHLNISLIIKILWVLHGKHLSDDSIREMLHLLKKIDMIPTAIAEQFNFTLPAL